MSEQVNLLRTYNQWRRSEIEGSMDDLGLHPSDIGKAINTVLDDYATLQAECERLRDALGHIEKTTQRSRTSTRRLRWIEQRCRFALEGKEYKDEAFDLPKMNTGSIERVSTECRALRAELKSLELVGVMLSDGDLLPRRTLGASLNSACALFTPVYALPAVNQQLTTE